MRLALGMENVTCGTMYIMSAKLERGGSTKIIERFCDLTKTSNFEDVI